MDEIDAASSSSGTVELYNDACLDDDGDPVQAVEDEPAEQKLDAAELELDDDVDANELSACSRSCSGFQYAELSKSFGSVRSSYSYDRALLPPMPPPIHGGDGFANGGISSICDAAPGRAKSSRSRSTCELAGVGAALVRKVGGSGSAHEASPAVGLVEEGGS